MAVASRLRVNFTSIRVGTLLQEEVPFGDAVRVAQGDGDGQFLRGARGAEEFQAGFVREAVAFAGVHVFARPDEVFPGVASAARAGQDVIEAAFVGAQDASRVLAAVAVAFADVFRAELGASLRHAGEVHGDDDGGHADGAARGAHEVVLLANGQGDPFGPGDGTNGLSGEWRMRSAEWVLRGVRRVLDFDVEAGGDVGGHLAEYFLRGADVDGLPVAVQDEHDGFVQYVGHKNSASPCIAGEVFGLCFDGGD